MIESSFESSLSGSRFNFSPTFFTIVIVLFPDRATVLHSELPQPVTNEPVNQQSTSVYVYVLNHILMANILKFGMYMYIFFVSTMILSVFAVAIQMSHVVYWHVRYGLKR